MRKGHCPASCAEQEKQAPVEQSPPWTTKSGKTGPEGTLKAHQDHLPALRQDWLHGAHHLYATTSSGRDLPSQMQSSHQRASALCCRLQGKLCSVWVSHFSCKSLLTHSKSCCWHYRGVGDLITEHLFAFHLQSLSLTLTN